MMNQTFVMTNFMLKVLGFIFVFTLYMFRNVEFSISASLLGHLNSIPYETKELRHANFLGRDATEEERTSINPFSPGYLHAVNIRNDGRINRGDNLCLRQKSRWCSYTADGFTEED